MLSRMYTAAIKRGMDKNISFDVFNKFDDIISNNIDTLKKDINANRIIKTPINELVKSDIDYIINFQ